MNSYQDRAYAAESQVRVLTKCLHDAEAELGPLVRGEVFTDAQVAVIEDAATQARDRAEAAESALATARARIAALTEALDNAIEYVEPCDKDEGRDYCMTHHEFRCPAVGFVATARALLSPAPADAAHEEGTP